MMRKTFVFKPVYLFWLILMVPLFGACQKEEDMEDTLKCPITPKEGSDDSIIGKWKLAKAHPFTGELQDYSCDNVIYLFKEDNNTLAVSGVRDGMISLSNGEYIFEFKEGVRIDNTNYAWSIQDNEMFLTLAYGSSDGSTMYFIRVE